MRGPKWNPKAPEMPIDKDGNWMHFPDYGLAGWEQVTPFDDDMKIDGMRSGRSAKYVILKSVATGRTYPMFVSDLVEFVRHGDIFNGVLHGTWTGSKRGMNYGIKAVK